MREIKTGFLLAIGWYLGTKTIDQLYKNLKKKDEKHKNDHYYN